MSSDLAVRKKRDDSLVVFLFYLLVDVSGSMAGELGTVNEMLVKFRDALKDEPVMEDMVQFCVISFSTRARVEVPLGNLASADFGGSLLKIGGATNYAEGLRMLRQTIEADARQLKAATRGMDPKAEQFRYYRPAAFFLTDGEPTDSWQSAFDDLKNYVNYPLFVPFGFRDADQSVLRQMVHPPEVSRLYLQRSGVTPAQVLKEMMEAMLRSIKATALSASTEAMHVLPTKKELGDNVEVQQYVGGNWMSL